MKDQDNKQAVNDESNEDEAVTGTDESSAADVTDQDAAEQQANDDQMSELESLQAELNRHKELALRIQAEAENVRKRMQRDFEKRRQFALESFMRELIGVRDSLERGLDVSQTGEASKDQQAGLVTPLREGMQMTLKQLDKVLADHGLSVVDPQGEAFNPEYHEAVTMQPSEEQEPNSVLQVVQKGYRLHDRLLRPAMVIVAKAAD